MPHDLYRYVFTTEVPVGEIEITLLLAILAVEALHGEVQTRLDANHRLNAEQRTCLIDASTAVGRALNRIFARFAACEFGEGAYRVERVGAERRQSVPST
jgi:hypothetical protein